MTISMNYGTDFSLPATYQNLYSADVYFFQTCGKQSRKAFIIYFSYVVHDLTFHFRV